MPILALLLHLMGFIAPAVGVALLVTAAARVLMPRGPADRSWRGQAAINSIAGVFALAAGLWYFGVDGKMATYAALVLATATCQWAGSRGWRG